MDFCSKARISRSSPTSSHCVTLRETCPLLTFWQHNLWPRKKGRTPHPNTQTHTHHVHTTSSSPYPLPLSHHTKPFMETRKPLCLQRLPSPLAKGTVKGGGGLVSQRDGGARASSCVTLGKAPTPTEAHPPPAQDWYREGNPQCCGSPSLQPFPPAPPLSSV